MQKTAGQKAREIHPDDLLLQFSPEMTRKFAVLEAAVNPSNQMGPEVWETLDDFANGRAMRAKEAFSWVAHIVKETTDHIHATGDKRVKQALDDLIECMWDVNKEPRYAPFTLIKSPAKQNER